MENKNDKEKIPSSSNITEVVKDFKDATTATAEVIKGMLNLLKTVSKISLDKEHQKGLKSLRKIKGYCTSLSAALSDIVAGIQDMVNKAQPGELEKLIKTLGASPEQVNKTFDPQTGKLVVDKSIGGGQGFFEILGSFLNTIKTVSELKPIPPRQMKKTIKSYMSVVDLFTSFLSDVQTSSTPDEKSQETTKTVVTAVSEVLSTICESSMEIIKASEDIIDNSDVIEEALNIVYNDDGKTWSILFHTRKIFNEILGKNGGEPLNKKVFEDYQEMLEAIGESSTSLIKSIGLLGTPLGEYVLKGLMIYHSGVQIIRGIHDSILGKDEGGSGEEMNEEAFSNYGAIIDSIDSSATKLVTAAIKLFLLPTVLRTTKFKTAEGKEEEMNSFQIYCEVLKSINVPSPEGDMVSNIDAYSAVIAKLDEMALTLGLVALKGFLLGMFAEKGLIQFSAILEAIKIPSPDSNAVSNIDDFMLILIGMDEMVPALFWVSIKLLLTKMFIIKGIQAFNEVILELQGSAAAISAMKLNIDEKKMATLLDLIWMMYLIGETHVNGRKVKSVLNALKLLLEGLADPSLTKNLSEAANNIQSIGTLGKDLESFFDALKKIEAACILIGIFALPAVIGMLGVILFLFALKIFFRIVGTIFEGMDSAAIKRICNDIYDSQKVFLTIGLVVGVSLLIGIAIVLAWKYILLGFAAMMGFFLLMFLMLALITIIARAAKMFDKKIRPLIQAMFEIEKVMIASVIVALAAIALGWLITKFWKLMLRGLGGMIVIVGIVIGLTFLASKLGKNKKAQKGIAVTLLIVLAMVVIAALILALGAIGQKINFIGLLLFTAALVLVVGVFIGIGALMSVGPVLMFLLLGAVALVLLGVVLLVLAIAFLAVSLVLNLIDIDKLTENLKKLIKGIVDVITGLEDVSIVSLIFGIIKGALILALTAIFMIIAIMAIITYLLIQKIKMSKFKKQLVGLFNAYLAVLDNLSENFDLGTIIEGVVKVVMLLVIVGLLLGVSLITLIIYKTIEKMKMDKFKSQATSMIDAYIAIIEKAGDLELIAMGEAIAKLGMLAVIAGELSVIALASWTTYQMTKNVKFGEFKSNVSEMISSYVAITSILDKVDIIKLGGAIWKLGMLVSISAMLFIVASIAAGIASLSYIQYGQDGKEKKRVNMQKSDFKKAIKNSEAVIDCILDIFIDDEGNETNVMTRLDDLDWWLPLKLQKVRRIAHVLGVVSKIVAKTAALTMPIEWNPEGDPIKYKTITARDLKAAIDGGTAIMNTILDVFVTQDGEDTAVVTRLDELDYWLPSKLQKVRRIAEVLGYTSAIVAAFSALKIPTGWDADGKPIGYSKIKQEDMVASVKNGEAILGALLDIFTYENGGKKPIIERLEEMNISLVIDMAILQTITRCIGNIAAIVASVAKLKMPTAFDEEGKPTAWSTITNQQLVDAALNSASLLEVMVSIFTADGEVTLSNGQKVNFPKLELDKIGWRVGLKMKLLEPAISAIAGVANTIAQLANTMVPDTSKEGWFDEKEGKVVHWKQLDSGTISKMGQNLATMMTAVVNVIKNMDMSTLNKLNEDAMEKLSTAMSVVQPLGDLVKLIADMSNGQFQRYVTNDKGEIIKDSKGEAKTVYVTFDEIMKDIPKISRNLGTILRAYVNSIGTVAADPKIQAKIEEIRDTFGEGLPTENIGKIIDEIAKMSVAQYKVIDEKTKKEKYVTLTVEDMQKAVLDTKTIVTDYINGIDDLATLIRTKMDNGMGENLERLNEVSASFGQIIKLLDDLIASADRVSKVKDVSKYSENAKELFMGGIIRPLFHITRGEMIPLWTNWQAIQPHMLTFLDAEKKLSEINISSEAADNMTKSFSATMALLDKVNSIDDRKLTKMANISKSMAVFSTKINGDFNGLARAMNENIIDALEKVNKALEELKEVMDELPEKVKEASAAGAAATAAANAANENSVNLANTPNGSSNNQNNKNGNQQQQQQNRNQPNKYKSINDCIDKQNGYLKVRMV